MTTRRLETLPLVTCPLAMLAAASGHASPIQWTTGSGGNLGCGLRSTVFRLQAEPTVWSEVNVAYVVKLRTGSSTRSIVD
jgi:hypothetical protein